MDDDTGDGEEKSSPVILDNVENFMLNIQEEIKNPEDNGDFDNDFHNDVDDVEDTLMTEKEVDDKHLILEPIALLGLPAPPEADRVKQGVVSTENMKNQSTSDKNHTKNYEEKESALDPIMDVDYETETVRNITKVMKIVDQEPAGSENPLLENNDTKKKGERLKLPKIRIQNARIKILSQVESETNNDDIVFIIYLNETDSREIETNVDIEDFIFHN